MYRKNLNKHIITWSNVHNSIAYDDGNLSISDGDSIVNIGFENWNKDYYKDSKRKIKIFREVLDIIEEEINEGWEND